MEEIIAPIAKEILKSELTEERRMRFTNKSNNEIYVVTAHNAPNVMKEIGRLREIAFRAAGGGPGKSMDIDEYDVAQLVLSIICDTYDSFITFDANPFVFASVLYVSWKVHNYKFRGLI